MLRRKFIGTALTTLAATAALGLPSIASPTVTITIDIGRKSQGCTGFGICSIKIGVGAALSSAKSIPGAAQLEGNILTVKVKETFTKGQQSIVVEEAIKLPGRAFGVKEITVLPGAHPIRGNVIRLNVNVL